MARPNLSALISKFLFRETLTTQDKADIRADIGAQEAGSYAASSHNQAASTITDFASASRAQTEAELVAGGNITITPAGSGATRTLTIDASGGGSSVTASLYAPEDPAEGDQWLRTSDGVTYTYFDGFWMAPSVPQAPGLEEHISSSTAQAGAATTQITNLVSCTLAAYEELTPDPDTLYLIVDP